MQKEGKKTTAFERYAREGSRKTGWGREGQMSKEGSASTYDGSVLSFSHVHTYTTANPYTDRKRARHVGREEAERSIEREAERHTAAVAPNRLKEWNKQTLRKGATQTHTYTHEASSQMERAFFFV